MKKFIESMLCAFMVLSLVACGNTNSKDNEQLVGANVQIPNPIIKYETIKQAQEAVGFNFNIPTNLPEGFEQDGISVISDKLAQVIYKNDDDEICYRISKGTDDISGDYNEYETNKTITIQNILVSISGNGDNVNVATWENDGYSYSIVINIGEEGIALEFVQNMIESVLQ